MPSEEDFISHRFNGAHVHVLSSEKTPGGFSPSRSKVINISSVYEYYVIKVAIEKQVNHTKPFNSITEHRQTR